MRVLLTNFSLAAVGGTEKWVWTMGRELQRRGWDVDAFTFHRGMVAEHLESLGVGVTDQVPKVRYDLILVNHNVCFEAIRTVPGPRIYTSHGPRNPLEVPPPGADAYAAVTPEVRDTWASLGFSMTVITNPLDLDEFAPNGPAQCPLRVLSVCKIPMACNIAATACERLGLPFEGVHYTLKPEWDMASVIRRSDVVIGCGRAALEGLACGKRVLVFDARDKQSGPKADGWLTAGNIDEMFARNLACRTANKPWWIGDMMQALANPPGDISWARPWAEAHCNVRHKVDAYLALAGLTEGAPHG